MSSGAYADDKALFYRERLQALREGKPIRPVHLHLIPSDYCQLACPGCFPPGTLVLTANGYEPIERVEVGMRVVTDDGSLHTVLKTMPHQHRGEMVHIRPSRLGSGITATANHPILTQRGYIRADEVVVGDEVAVQVPQVPRVEAIRASRVLDGLFPVGRAKVRVKGGKTHVKDLLPLKSDLGEWLGAFLGDGHVQRLLNRPGSYEADISLGAHERGIAKHLTAVHARLFGLRANVHFSGGSDSVINVVSNNSVVGRLMLALARTGSHDKQFSPALFGAPREFLEGLLRGYAWADGCVDDKSFSTVSKPLALLVYGLLLREGMSPTLFDQPGRPALIKGRVIHAIGPRYLIRLRGDDRTTYDRIVGLPKNPKEPDTRNWAAVPNRDGKWWLPVSEVSSKPYAGPVYNLEVEGRHTYVADGLVVHNCAYRLEGYPSNQLFAEHGDNNPKRFLPDHILDRVVKDCVEMGTTGLEVTGGGEPTLHPRIVPLLTQAQEAGLKTALITNGLTLGRQDLLYRAAKCAWVRISIDAASDAMYDLVRPSLGGAPSKNFRNVLGHLGRLSILRDDVSSPVDCVIGAGFVVQKQNWREIYAAARMYRDHGADNIRISGCFTPQGDAYFNGWKDQALELEQRAIADFDKPGGFRVYGRLGEKIADLHAPPDYQDCWYQRFTLYLGADANLYRCCVTSYNKLGLLGNVVEAGGLKALLDRPEVQEKLRSFDARTCPRCQFNDRNRAIAKALGEEPRDVAKPMHAEFV